MTRRKQTGEETQLRSIKLEPVTNVTATRGYNVGKGIASTTVSIKADVAPTLADHVMNLASEGGALWIILGTDQLPLFGDGADPEAGEPQPEEPLVSPDPTAEE